MSLAERMRARIGDLALSTDLIVGFPGETEQDFEQTLSLVSQVGFDSAFTFVFSPRNGTEAASLPDHVPEEVVSERIQRLVERVQETALAQNKKRVGLVENVLTEGTSRTNDAVLRGRTRRNTTVNFTGHAQPGEFVPVRIHKATSATLGGIQVDARAADGDEAASHLVTADRGRG
jgi:tRNA-2-methylthio-N6-dimethylallyladenosine synthase